MNRREQFLDQLTRLRVNREPPIKPQKPILLCAAIILIHKGKIRSPRIYLDGALKSVFFQIFDALFPRWPMKTRPKPSDPFRALRSDGIWELVPKQDSVKELEDALARGVWSILGHIQCAKLDAQVFEALTSDPTYRFDVLEVLCRTYLPPGATRTLLGMLGPDRKTWELQEDLKERAVEEFIESRWKQGNLYLQEGIRLADPDIDHIRPRQVVTTQSTIDLLGYQEADKAWWVFELKYQDPKRDVVAQTLGYKYFVRTEKATARQQVVGAVLTDESTTKLNAAAEEGNIQVWTYDVDDFQRGRLAFERVV